MNRYLHTATPLARGLRELLVKLAERLDLSSTIKVYIAGGMAVHLYTAARTTTDLDAEFSARFHMPSDVMAEVINDDGTKQLVYLDPNYNSTFSLIHEEYQDAAVPIDLGVEHFDVRLLSPVDLAVSKISRFAENDREDIRALVLRGLTTAAEIEARATAAMAGYVGNMSSMRQNLRDAVKIAKLAELDAPMYDTPNRQKMSPSDGGDLGNGP